MIIERHILKEVSQYGVLGVAFFTFVSIGGRLFQYLEMFMEKGIPLCYGGKLIAFMIPSFLLYVVPMATLWGVLLTLTRMNADREILVLKCSGVQGKNFLRPILLLSAFSALLTASLTFWVIPESVKAFRRQLFQVAKEAVKPRVKDGTFYTFIPGIVLFVEETDGGEVLRGVMLFDERDPDHEVLIIAKEGHLTRDEKTGRIALILSHGELHRKGEGEYSVMRFEGYTFTVSPEELLKGAEEKAQVRLLEKEMSVGELRGKIEQRKKEGKDIRPQLVELHLKFALPFSPLILGLLGLGLGMQRTRSGRSFGLVLSLLVIISYYGLYLVGKGMASAGLLPPSIGAWFANFSLLALGIYLLWKSLQESPILVLELLEDGLDVLKRLR